MWWTEWSWAVVGALLLCAGTPSQAQKAAVCPLQHQGALQQIHLFDGTPESLVHLAPDDAKRSSDTYSVSPLYASGSFLTVRCTYEGGSIIDWQFRKLLTQCVFRASRGAYGNLHCR